MTRRPSPVWRVIAALPEALYRGAVAARNRWYDARGGVRVGVPVLSVGNLTVGGTGKTPLVAWTCARLIERGRIPAVVSRGYGGTSGDGPVVVSDGGGRRVGPEIAGDEPCLLTRAIPGLRVITGADRIAGAAEAVRLGADVVVLDDGFQHRRIARDLDVVLLDAGDPFGGDRMLPAGRLREPPSSLRRADAVVLTRVPPGGDVTALAAEVARRRPGIPVVLADHRASGFVDRAGETVRTPTRAVAFCGIGTPARFLADLEAAGVEVVAHRAFADHHAYRPRDLAPLLAEASRRDAVPVTTEKDLARLDRPDAPPVAGVVALRIEATVHDPGPLLAAIEAALEDR